MSVSRYRPDIDGLRGVAVVCVLLFHLDVPGFQGGYVGVDVFFVISGFLITRLIADEYRNTGRFRFSAFYVRRMRRLFPSLFCTLCLCFIAAALLFTPEDLRRFGGSFVLASLGLSNFYFWSEAGYFDASATLKPLLHTWSLGVEEQFYLIWPILIAFLMKTRSNAVIWVALFSVFLVSLAANIVFSDGFTYFRFLGTLFADGPATIFYLMPFRAFEFAIGAGLAYLPTIPARFAFVRGPMLLLGLTAIGAATWGYDDELVFPSYYALLPCIGAALVIYGGESPSLGIVLRNRLIVGIGLVSYSAYLVHWPLIVFYQYLKLGDLDYADKFLITLSTFFIAAVLYKYIEQPFRRGRAVTRRAPNSRFVIGSLSLSVLLVLPGTALWASSGWLWRLDQPVIEPLRDFAPCSDARQQPCRIGAADSGASIWVGDSLMQQYIPILSGSGTGAKDVYYRGGCPMLPTVTRKRDGKMDRACVEATRLAYDAIGNSENKDIFVSLYWKEYFAPESDTLMLADGQLLSESGQGRLHLLEGVLRKLGEIAKERGHRIVLIDHVANERFDTLYRCMNTPINLCGEISPEDTFDTLNKGRPLNDQRIAEQIEANGLAYFDPLLNFCDQKGGQCNLFLSKDRELVLHDHIHFTPAGAQQALFGFANDIRDVGSGSPPGHSLGATGRSLLTK